MKTTNAILGFLLASAICIASAHAANVDLSGAIAKKASKKSKAKVTATSQQEQPSAHNVHREVFGQTATPTVGKGVVKTPMKPAPQPSPGSPGSISASQGATISATAMGAAVSAIEMSIDHRFSQDEGSYSAEYSKADMGTFTFRGRLDPCLSWGDLPDSKLDVVDWDAKTNSWPKKSISSKVFMIAHLTCNPPAKIDGTDLYDCGAHGSEFAAPVYAICSPEGGQDSNKFKCDVDVGDLFLRSDIYYWYNNKTTKEKIDSLLSDFNLKVSFVNGQGEKVANTGGNIDQNNFLVLPQSKELAVKPIAAEKTNAGSMISTSYEMCSAPGGQTPGKFRQDLSFYIIRLPSGWWGPTAIVIEGVLTGDLKFDDLLPNKFGEKVSLWIEKSGGLAVHLPSQCVGNPYWPTTFTCTVDISDGDKPSDDKAKAVAALLGLQQIPGKDWKTTVADFFDYNVSPNTKISLRTGSLSSCGLCRSPLMSAAEIQAAGVQVSNTNVVDNSNNNNYATATMPGATVSNAGNASAGGNKTGPVQQGTIPTLQIFPQDPAVYSAKTVSKQRIIFSGEYSGNVINKDNAKNIGIWPVEDGNQIECVKGNNESSASPVFAYCGSDAAGIFSCTVYDDNLEYLKKLQPKFAKFVDALIKALKEGKSDDPSRPLLYFGFGNDGGCPKYRSPGLSFSELGFAVCGILMKAYAD